MLTLQVQRPFLVINCTIRVPESVLRSLNCANYYQSADPAKQAAAKLADRKAQKGKQPFARVNEVIKTVQNAADSQFVFDCFDGNKKEQSDMAFLTVVRNYNNKHKSKPITKDTLIKAIKQIQPIGYKESKIYQASPSNPTPQDNRWCHIWHVPLKTVFGNDWDTYEWVDRDRVYVKLRFDSEPLPNSSYDPSADIHVDSLHRDSDSCKLDPTTQKTNSWWTDDVDVEEERNNMREDGLKARDEIPGLAKPKAK